MSVVKERIFFAAVNFFIIFILLFSFSAYAEEETSIAGSWRYKTTVVVETPEGIKTGSAVREISNSNSINRLNLTQSGNPAKVVGEPVVVDLGERGMLFALLKAYKRGEDHGSDVLYDVFPPFGGCTYGLKPCNVGGGTTIGGIKYYKELFGAQGNKSVVLNPTDYPLLVMFKDIDDPKTVTLVQELESNRRIPVTYTIKADHFEEFFGEGVRLKEISIEMTDEPVTRTIISALPWLPDRKNIRGYFGSTPEQPFNDITKTYLTGREFKKD
ncbi:MAG: hypothetical protein KKA05_06070 [Alphaproteobacteria bacterium]|nr:hypothetical protein [Alphaproteobacteria bacterium]